MPKSRKKINFPHHRFIETSRRYAVICAGSVQISSDAIEIYQTVYSECDYGEENKSSQTSVGFQRCSVHFIYPLEKFLLCHCFILKVYFYKKQVSMYLQSNFSYNPNLFKECIKYNIVDEYQLPQVEGSPVMG